MKYDPIMCMMVDYTVKTKDGLDDPEKNAGYEMKKEGQYFKIYKNGKLIGMKSTEEEARREAARHRAANDYNTLDKAIKSCDATSISSAKSGLKSKIDNWYRNAKIDYGVSGKFIDVREESGALVVYWEEDGKRKKYSFGKYWDDYSVEQLYNIWMEQAD